MLPQYTRERGEILPVTLVEEKILGRVAAYLGNIAQTFERTRQA